ncbi:MAG: hypothetical protein H7834_12620, partial [Magnetococcus sp. YQC-9]
MRSFSQGCVQDAQGRFQKAETTPAKVARGAFFAKNASDKSGLKSKAKSWEMNLPYMVRPALQGKIFTESTREKLHPYIRPMIEDFYL